MLKKYNKMSDEELLKLCEEHDTAAEDCLARRYKGLVLGKARAMYLIGGDQQDLIQEGMIGLMLAIRGYDSGQGASFYHFAEKCVTRKMYSAIEASNRQKHIPLNSYVSLYEELPSESESRVTLQEVLQSVDGKSPEELLIDKENVQRLDEELETRLSDLEREVLNLNLTGMGYVEIAEVLDKTPKQIDNTLQRVKTKLRSILEETR